LAENLTRRRIPFALDLCDNIFGLGYRSKLKFTNADGFRAMATMASHIVVTGDALAREVRANVPVCVEPVVVPDAALSEADHYRLSRWHAQGGLSSKPSYRHAANLSGMARRRRLGYYRRHPRAAMAQLGNLIGKGCEDDLGKSGIRTGHRIRKVIWFGKHGTSHSDSGMKGLLVTIPFLEHFNRQAPVELVVISNNRAKFAAHFSQLGIKTRYRKWSNEAVYQEMKDADAFLMPNAADVFSACKSANRALLALACGVPVIASQLESLEPLRDAIVLDDWHRGLEKYLFDAEARRTDLDQAAEIIRSDFSFDAIGSRWFRLLQEQLAAASTAYSDSQTVEGWYSREIHRKPGRP
jgi:glycosyltransferase involved in cell wall biosynthesis